MQTRLNINDVIYGEDKLISVETESVVMGDECPACGNACASTITVELLCPAEYIPQNAKMVLQISSDGVNWVSKGVYWIDTRRKDRNARNEAVTMHIEGFDGILKAEQDYQMPEGTWVNMTDAQLLAQVCEDAGIETDWVPDGEYTIDIAPEAFNGRQIIGFIAAMYGGNAVMDGDGKLKLVPLNAGSGTAAVSWAEAMYVGDQMPGISAVLLHNMQGGKYLAESEDYSYGVTMNIDCPWATQPMADAILESMEGYSYQPFELRSAGLSPTVGIGDTVTFRGITERIYSMSLSYGKAFVATISAPDRNECEHDYQAKSGSGGGGGGAGKKADKEEVRFAMKEYAADIGDVKSGLYAVASADDLKNIKTAQTTLYAKIFDEEDSYSLKSQLDLKVKQEPGKETATAIVTAATSESVAKIKLESITSGDKSKSVASILADAICLDGKTNVIDLLTAENGLKVNDMLHVVGDVDASGDVYADSITLPSDGLIVRNQTFQPVDVTSIFTIKDTSTKLNWALAVK